MPTTNNINLNYLDQNMAGKEIVINEALLAIDALLNTGAKSRVITTPPTSPANGDLYIIPASPTGAWSGHAGKFTYYHSSKGWVIMVPNEGMTLWVADEDALCTFNGTAWVSSGGSGSGGGSSPTELGVNTTADSTNKLAVKSSAVLFDNIGGNAQVKVNKFAAADSASHLFQTNYSGRAEFGLTGDDDFHVKVSPDGSAWHEALVVDKTNGVLKAKKRVNAEAGISFDGGTNTLAFYQKGTWTPVIVGTTITGTNSYAAQLGDYTRIGDLVIVDMLITLTALSSTGILRINGLPFAPLNTTRWSGRLTYGGFSFPAGGGSVTAVTTGSSTFLTLQFCSNTGMNNITNSQATASMDVRGSVIYRVA